MRFHLSSSQSLDHAGKNGKDRANGKTGRANLQADERFALFFGNRATQPMRSVQDRAGFGHHSVNATSAADQRARSSASQRPQEAPERVSPRRSESAPQHTERSSTRSRDSQPAAKRTDKANDSKESTRTAETAHDEQGERVEQSQQAAQPDKSGRTDNADSADNTDNADNADSTDEAQASASAAATTAQAPTDIARTGGEQGAATAEAAEANAAIAQEQVQQDSVEAENIAALTALVAGMTSSQPVLDPAVAMVVEDGLALTLDGEGGKPAKTIVAQWLSMQAGTAKGKAENSATVDVGSQGAGDDLLASEGEGKDGKNNPALLKAASRANPLAAAQDKPIVLGQEARNAAGNNFMAAFSNAVAARSGAGGQGGQGGEGGNNALSPQLLHANGAGAGNSPQGRTNNTASLPQLPVYTPAGQRAWAEDVAVRLNWMANRGQGKAELMLTPPSLGRLGVSLQMNGDQISAHFVTATAAARDLLEQALPRLREILQQSNIHLGQSDVSTEQQSFFQQQNGADGSQQGRASTMRGASGLSGADDDDSTATVATSSRRLDGIVDVFA